MLRMKRMIVNTREKRFMLKADWKALKEDLFYSNSQRLSSYFLSRFIPICILTSVYNPQSFYNITSNLSSCEDFQADTLLI